MKIAIIRPHAGMLTIPAEHLDVLAACSIVREEGYGENRTLSALDSRQYPIDIEIVDDAIIDAPRPAPKAETTTAPTANTDVDF